MSEEDWLSYERSAGDALCIQIGHIEAAGLRVGPSADATDGDALKGLWGRDIGEIGESPLPELPGRSPIAAATLGDSGGRTADAGSSG